MTGVDPLERRGETVVPGTRMMVARFSVSGRIFCTGAGAALVVFPIFVTVTDAWATFGDLVGFGVCGGLMAGLLVAARGVRLDVRDGMATVVNLTTVWRMPVWSVLSVSASGGLTLTVDPPVAIAHRAARKIEVTAVQGSLIEQLRGNPRANAAIRRLEGARAASPWIDPAVCSPTRRIRWELAAYCLIPPALLTASQILIAGEWGTR